MLLMRFPRLPLQVVVEAEGAEVRLLQPRPEPVRPQADPHPLCPPLPLRVAEAVEAPAASSKRGSPLLARRGGRRPGWLF